MLGFSGLARALSICVLAGCAVDGSGVPKGGGGVGGGFGGTAGMPDGVGGVGGGSPECIYDDDCPADQAGPWSECGFESECDREASRRRFVRTHACIDNVCEPSDRSETEPCERDTEGSPCGPLRECEPLPGEECIVLDEGFCAEIGTTTVGCTRYECSAGVCTPYDDGEEIQECEVDTDGTFCGLIDICECLCEPGCVGEVQCTSYRKACAAGVCAVESATPKVIYCPG